MNYLSIIWRLNIGSFAIALASIPYLAVSAHIAATYSLRRKIGDPRGPLTPIWQFRTQQLPVLHALAQVYVMKAFARETALRYNDKTLDWRTRMGLATTLKVMMVMTTSRMLASLEDRCGAQGIYAHNQIITKEVSSSFVDLNHQPPMNVASQFEARGIAIAEGDVLILSISKYLIRV